MAMAIHQIGFPLSALAFSDTSTNKPIFESDCDESISSLDGASALENYFGRIHKEYEGVDTANIEEAANRILEEQDQSFMNFVRRETLLRDTFFQRLFETKTPLGEVLQELQNSQESPNRKLLSKEKYNAAEIEAAKLQTAFAHADTIITKSLAMTIEKLKKLHPEMIDWSSVEKDGEWYIHGLNSNGEIMIFHVNINVKRLNVD